MRMADLYSRFLGRADPIGSTSGGLPGILNSMARRSLSESRTTRTRKGSPRATARAENRRFWRLSALRAHTKAPYKMHFHRKTLRNAKGA